jgi:hypothetical protein
MIRFLVLWALFMLVSVSVALAEPYSSKHGALLKGASKSSTHDLLRELEHDGQLRALLNARGGRIELLTFETGPGGKRRPGWHRYNKVYLTGHGLQVETYRNGGDEDRVYSTGTTRLGFSIGKMHIPSDKVNHIDTRAVRQGVERWIEGNVN